MDPCTTLDTRDHRLRFLYVAWAALENLGYGGLTYGWGSLVYVLKDEGIYQELCNNLSERQFGNKTHKDCEARESKLELVYTFASVSVGLGSFILGQVNFKFGTRASRLVASTMFILGAFMIAFVTIETPWLIFPGLSFAAFGGIGLLIANYQLANLFNVGKGAVLGILNGSFDSSDGIQLMVKFGYENGIARKTSYLILACTHFLTFVSTFIFLPRDYIRSVQHSDGQQTRENISGQFKQPEHWHSGNFRELLNHILSRKFLFHLCWYSVLVLRFNCMLGSMSRTFQQQLDSTEEVSRFTNILMYTMMGGIITSPLSGVFLQINVGWFQESKSAFGQVVKPMVMPLALSTTYCAVMSALVLFEKPRLLYAIFVLLLLLRSSLYTYNCAYIIRTFPTEYLSSMLGITTLVGCIVSLLQHPIFLWAGQRSSFEAHSFLLILTCLTYIHPTWLLTASMRLEKQPPHGYDPL